MKYLLSILVFFALGLFLFCSCQGYAVRQSRIERITGCEFPDYKVIDKSSGSLSFMGDYNDVYTAEFKSEPSADFYEQIEKAIDGGLDDNGYNSIFWTSDINGRDTIYSFHSMWGNGLPAPEGESEDADGFLNIKIRKGDKVFEITEGRW